MTPARHGDRVPTVESAPVAAAPFVANAENAAAVLAASHGAPDLAAWNRALNRTHDMAGMRARAGRLVRTIERRRRALVAARVVRGTHARAVDLGCEDAWMTEAWAPRVSRLALVDVDPDVLARSSLARRRGVETHAADATDARALSRALGLRAWDVVVASALLEHVPDPDAALAAWTALLAPHGRLVLYVPADRPILAAKAVLRATRLGSLVRGLSLDPAPGHLHRFGRADLARLLARHGRVAEIAFDPAVLGYVAVVRESQEPVSVGRLASAGCGLRSASSFLLGVAPSRYASSSLLASRAPRSASGPRRIHRDRL
jgi:SAM-dependent methyltransferase